MKCWIKQKMWHYRQKIREAWRIYQVREGVCFTLSFVSSWLCLPTVNSSAFKISVSLLSDQPASLLLENLLIPLQRYRQRSNLVWALEQGWAAGHRCTVRDLGSPLLQESYKRWSETGPRLHSCVLIGAHVLGWMASSPSRCSARCTRRWGHLTFPEPDITKQVTVFQRFLQETPGRR